MPRMPYETPDEECPYCGATCSAEFVDIGVGMQQVTPYACVECHAVECGAYDDDSRTPDPNTGWYAPPDYEPSEAQQGLLPIPDGYNEA